ncbi:MAG TPA: cytochrome c biogenesis protein CcsA [Candidatus Limnocylindrales bacterium]
MSVFASILFPIGVVAIAIAFAAHVGHAVLLANGRRSIGLALNPAPQRPAWAGAVTGSFADGRLASADADPGDAPLGLAATPLGRAAQIVTVVGFAALAAYLLARGLVVGRGPWGNMFEFTVAFATSITGGYLYLSRRYPIRSIGFIPTGVALGLLLYAASLPSQISQLVPALQNPPLITIHVGLAVLSYGIFATSFAAGVGYLVQGQHDRFAWLPGHKVLDEVAYRSVIIGFPIFATMIILGSWWASIAWSRYWGWDPKETAALITWLSYAVYLHARNQKSWAGRPAALLLVVAFGMVIVTYSGSLWFNGLHSYSGL